MSHPQWLRCMVSVSVGQPMSADGLGPCSGLIVRESGCALGWLNIVQSWAQARDVPQECVHQITAFGWEGEARVKSQDASFTDLEARSVMESRVLAKMIGNRLVPEVNEAQAALFGRRFNGVSHLLQALAKDSDVGRILFVAFVQRTSQVLDVGNPPAEKPPRALRVRAVADYFYSLGAVEVHRQRRKHDGSSAVTLSTLIEQATWTKQMSGLHWTTLEGMLDNGPFRATISCVDASQFTMEAADLRDACDRGQTFEESVRDRHAVLGVSGGFFLYSEPDIVTPSRRYDPVDCLIRNGSLLNPPCFGRPCVIQRRSGRVDIQRLQPTGMRVSGAGFSCVVDEVNWHVWTRTNGLVVPSGGTHVVVIGTRVVSISRGNPTSIPLNGWVLVGPEAVWPKWTVGQTLQFVFEDTADPVWNVMAGGPWLYAAGDVSLPDSGFSGTAPPRTFSADETGDCNLLPRMAVGVRPDNTVVFAAVDGRHFERALGMTLAQLGQLMGHLGCITSMNLDGGASKRMVVGGRVQDLSTSDVVGTHGSEHVRPVRTALFWSRRALQDRD